MSQKRKENKTLSMNIEAKPFRFFPLSAETNGSIPRGDGLETIFDDQNAIDL